MAHDGYAPVTPPVTLRMARFIILTLTQKVCEGQPL